MNSEYLSEEQSADVLDRLVKMTAQTCLVALDKTIAAVRRSHSSYAAASARCGSIAERMVRASHEIGIACGDVRRNEIQMSDLNDPKSFTPKWTL